MKIKRENLQFQRLAELVYEFTLRKQIEEEMKSKYSKRIEYLVGANNELARELEQHGLIKIDRARPKETKKKVPTLVDGTYYDL